MTTALNSPRRSKTFRGLHRGHTEKNRAFDICPNGALSVLFGVAGVSGKYYNINVKCLRAFHFGTELACANQIERIRIMSVVIIGGNERMERRYKELCESYSCKTKVFTKKAGNMKNLGSPDLLVMFTDTMSHKMLKAVMSEARGRNIRIAHSRSSSMAALKSILDEHIEGGAC